MTTQDRELLEQAADALEGMYERYAESECGRAEDAKAAAIALRSRLAQPDAIGAAGGEVTDGFQEWLEHGDGMKGIRNAWDAAIAFKSAAPKSGDMAQGECAKCRLPKSITCMECIPAASTGAGQIAILEAAYDAVKKLAVHNQAKIDSLMLEYCPDEMTAEQTAEWAKHQKPAAAQPKGDGNG